MAAMTPDLSSDELRLAMWDWKPPCMAHAFNGEDGVTAKWIVHYEHDTDVDDCQPYSMPVCSQHKTTLAAVAELARWNGRAPVHCEECEEPMRLDRVTAIVKPEGAG